MHTADLCDTHGDDLQVVDPIFASFGDDHFSGPIRTVKCHEDNTHVRGTLESPGNGAVLVVDGGGSLRCALVGDQLAQLGIDNGWAGIIVYGCIRDADTIDEMEIGIKALNTSPRKSQKRGEGRVDVPVTFGGVTFRPGSWLYADSDGVVVSEREL
jgi:regulator of ribonuclease activity A